MHPGLGHGVAAAVEPEAEVNTMEFLLARVEEDEARASNGWSSLGTHRWHTDNYGRDSLTPAAVLAESAAKRAIIDVVTAWVHSYCDEDNWYSCGLAVIGTGASISDGDYIGPGSGCSDEERRGTCNCGLERRQMQFLAPMSAVYADHPDYEQEWKI